MSAMECVKSTVVNKEFLIGKVKILTKIAKPVLRLMSRRRRTNVVTPSTCNYECEQNETNETALFHVEFTFHEPEQRDNEANERLEEDENAANEALERRLAESVAVADTTRLGIALGGGTVLPVAGLPGTYFAVPAQFLETVPGQFTWVPLPAADSDVIKQGDSQPLSQCQVAQQQVPCC